MQPSEREIIACASSAADTQLASLAASIQRNETASRALMQTLIARIERAPEVPADARQVVGVARAMVEQRPVESADTPAPSFCSSTALLRQSDDLADALPFPAWDGTLCAREDADWMDPGVPSVSPQNALRALFVLLHECTLALQGLLVERAAMETASYARIRGKASPLKEVLTGVFELGLELGERCPHKELAEALTEVSQFADRIATSAADRHFHKNFDAVASVLDQLGELAAQMQTLGMSDFLKRLTGICIRAQQMVTAAVPQTWHAASVRTRYAAPIDPIPEEWD